MLERVPFALANKSRGVLPGRNGLSSRQDLLVFRDFDGDEQRKITQGVNVVL